MTTQSGIHPTTQGLHHQRTINQAPGANGAFNRSTSIKDLEGQDFWTSQQQMWSAMAAAAAAGNGNPAAFPPQGMMAAAPWMNSMMSTNSLHHRSMHDLHMANQMMNPYNQQFPAGMLPQVQAPQHAKAQGGNNREQSPQNSVSGSHRSGGKSGGNGGRFRNKKLSR